MYTVLSFATAPSEKPEEIQLMTQLSEEMIIPSVQMTPIAVTDSSLIFQKLDAYFDQAIKKYSFETQETLREYYYEGKEQEEIVGLQKKNGNFAQLDSKIIKGDFEYKVRVDASISKKSLFRRISMIHEIAGHLGQRLEWEKKIGKEAYLKNYKRPGFKAFLEFSAFHLEKTIVDSLPEQVVEQDIREKISDPVVSRKALKKYGVMRHSKPEEVALRRWKMGYARRLGTVSSETALKFHQTYLTRAQEIESTYPRELVSGGEFSKIISKRIRLKRPAE